MQLNCPTPPARILWPGMPWASEATERTEQALPCSSISDIRAQNCFGVIRRKRTTLLLDPFGLVGLTDPPGTDAYERKYPHQ